MTRKPVISMPDELRHSDRLKDVQAAKFIAEGGTDPKQQDTTAMTLRLPTWVAQKIDGLRKDRMVKVSRNQWILEAIEDKLEKEG
jgi:hypothetical protein